MAWQLENLESLAGQPNCELDKIEKAAYELSTFIENAPNDFLEPLIESPFGRVYKLFLERCCCRKFLSTTSEGKKIELSQKLRQCGCETPEGWAIMLAMFSYFPPKELKIEGAQNKLPEWLLPIYEKRYEPEQQVIESTSEEISFNNRIFLNKILGLSNLYYIDPEDKEILEELKVIRYRLIGLMLDSNNDDFATQFQGEFGDRYWAMAQCGIQSVELDINESQKRDEMQKWLSETPQSLHQNGGIQRLAALLLLNKPGTIRLANPDENLPKWFVEGYKRISTMALS